MANIQQAARWLNDGEKVTRPEFKTEGSFYSNDTAGFIEWESKHPAHGQFHDMIEVADLLADDWEIAE